MKKRYSILYIRLLFSLSVFYLFLLGCSQTDTQQGKQEDDGLISTEIVNNPITASGDSKNKDQPQITFENEVYDFGKIIQGEKVTYSYQFKNTGNKDLIISSVSASCGCTVPSWSKDPVAPGGVGKVNVVFDSDGKKGRQQKDITVITNSVPNTKVLRIAGEVLLPDDK